MINFTAFFRLAGLVIILALGAGVIWFQHQATQARRQVVEIQQHYDRAMIENSRQAQLIQQMHVLDARKEALLKDYSGQIVLLQSQQNHRRDQLQELTQNDETIRTFLATPLPDALKQLLNDN